MNEIQKLVKSLNTLIQMFTLYLFVTWIYQGMEFIIGSLL